MAAVEIELNVLPPAWLECTYRIRAGEDEIVYPAPTDRLDPERLWEHTCCELFVADASQPSYEEWNFSPTGQHAHFEFDAYRERRASPERLPAKPKVKVDARVQSGSMVLQVRVPVARPRSGATIVLSPTVVLADAEGRRSHWALRHPSEQPDFHRREGFGLALT